MWSEKDTTHIVQTGIQNYKSFRYIICTTNRTSKPESVLSDPQNQPQTVENRLNDLYRLGDLPAKLTQDVRATFAAVYGSVRTFASRLMESLRNDYVRPDARPDPGSMQIRFPDPPRVLMIA